MKEYGPDQPLNLRYCQQTEVETKRKKFLIFKQKYLQKHQNLKLQAQRMQNMCRIQKWVEKELYTSLYPGLGLMSKSQKMTKKNFLNISKNSDDQETLRMKQYQNYLLDYAEKVMKDRRMSKR